MSHFLKSEGTAVRRSKRLSISEDAPMPDRNSFSATSSTAIVGPRAEGRGALQNITNTKAVPSSGTRNKGSKKSRKQSGDQGGESAAKRVQTRSRSRIGSDDPADESNLDPAFYNPFGEDGLSNSLPASQDLPPMEDEPAAPLESQPKQQQQQQQQQQQLSSHPPGFGPALTANNIPPQDLEKILHEEQQLQHLQRQQQRLAPEQQTQILQQHREQEQQIKVAEAKPAAAASVTAGVDQLAISVKPENRAVAAVATAAATADGGKPRWNNNLYVDNDPALLYAEDIYRHLRENEIKYKPMENYMAVVQSDINTTMRSILVDWLVEVAEEYKLSSQTLFLTVHFIDRALSVIEVNRSKLQLLGITAMLVAAKYEEIYPPSIEEFVYISDLTYTRDQVIAMEKLLLSSLKFSLSCATPWEFARRFTHVGKLSKQAEALTNFICEFFLQDPNYTKYPPSVIAASAVFLACYNNGFRPWTKELEAVSGYSIVDLTACVNELQACWWRIKSEGQSLRAVRDKFGSEKFFKVSEVMPRRLLP